MVVNQCVKYTFDNKHINWRLWLISQKRLFEEKLNISPRKAIYIVHDIFLGTLFQKAVENYSAAL